MASKRLEIPVHKFILLREQYVYGYKLVRYVKVLSAMMNKLINSFLRFSFPFFL